MYAIIRIRGTVKIAPKISTTLELLNLKRVNNLSVWPETEQTKQMVKMVMDYVAYGNISSEVLTELIEKRGKSIEEGKKIDVKKAVKELESGKTMNNVGIFNCFRMSPPRKGYERKGIKVPFKLGGASGDRKEKINDLILRMI
ncbi:MAG: uL30 family ribosomal protein [archaeon]|jgi:large subunit ribosomal protein L30